MAQDSPTDQVCSQELESILAALFTSLRTTPKVESSTFHWLHEVISAEPNKDKRKTRRDETIDAAMRS